LCYILNDKILKEEFEYFLTTKIFCKENLDFWFACVKYLQTNDPEARKKLGIEIFNEYISEGCPTEINVPNKIFRNVYDAIQSGNCTPQLFDAARLHIFALLSMDSFSKFIESSEFLGNHT